MIKNLSTLLQIACITSLPLIISCDKEDPDELSPSDFEKGITIVTAADGKQYEVVDMGFPGDCRFWAKCNLGATKPEQYGNYYSWGETQTKESYTITNYKFLTIHGTIDERYYDKYTMSNDKKTYKIYAVDNKSELDSIDDAATVLLGDNWRTPSRFELKMLIERSDYKCGHLNGVWGYQITSRDNGNSIFLPLTGFMDYTDNYHKESVGYYWTRELKNTHDAYYLSFNKPHNPVLTRFEDRTLGLTIRPIYRE